MSRAPDELSDALLTLLLAPHLGPATMRKLLDRFATCERIVAATVQDLTDIPGIGRETAASLRRAFAETNPDEERLRMREHDARLIVLGDDDYPPLLATIPDPPSAIWIRGRLIEADRLAIAIVGSRNCTAYGRDQTGRLASLLAQSGLTVVSGGALGVDSEAHRGALRVNGRTIAVLGCGLARCYPPQNEDLFKRIVDSGGAVVSEFAMMVEPLAKHFPRRNRIISGLSLGVLVTEAARRSGALITARLAAEEHHREVMALPGRVDSPASIGCLRAIQQGWAAMVLDQVDILQQLDASSQLVRGALEAAGHDGASSKATLFDGSLTDDQQKIISAFDDRDDILATDQIAARTQLPLSRIHADLTLLQIRGLVTRDHKGIRLRLPTT